MTPFLSQPQTEEITPETTTEHRKLRDMTEEALAQQGQD